MSTVRYRVRVESTGARSTDAYVTRAHDGLPIWTWTEPSPLELGEAELLRRDTIGLCGGTLRLEESVS